LNCDVFGRKVDRGIGSSRVFSMKRREFMTLVGGASVWPLAARAQQGAGTPVIGWIDSGARAPLGEIGWINGRNIRIEHRFAEARYDRSSELIAELAGLKADVIVTHAPRNVMAAKRATSAMPPTLIARVRGD
jgi:putative ABC transport system substrate-binding protein